MCLVPILLEHVKNDRNWLRPFLPIKKGVTSAFTIHLQRHQFTKKKKQVALIMLIIDLQFDVSTSFNM